MTSFFRCHKKSCFWQTVLLSPARKNNTTKCLTKNGKRHEFCLLLCSSNPPPKKNTKNCENGGCRPSKGMACQSIVFSSLSFVIRTQRGTWGSVQDCHKTVIIVVTFFGRRICRVSGLGSADLWGLRMKVLQRAFSYVFPSAFLSWNSLIYLTWIYMQAKGTWSAARLAATYAEWG